MKPQFPTVAVVIGGVLYTVHLRVTPGRKPSRVGADSPRFLDPECPPRVQVIRILRAGVVIWDRVTNDLLYWTRRSIEEAALVEAAALGYRADGTCSLTGRRRPGGEASALSFQLGGASAES